jgi:hypothetical protein
MENGIRVVNIFSHWYVQSEFTPHYDEVAADSELGVFVGAF